MQKTGIHRVSRGGSIADGIYSATSSSSFNKDGETYKATVTVTVSGGKISALTATGPTKSSDNQEYFAEAFSGIKSRLVGTTASNNSGSGLSSNVGSAGVYESSSASSALVSVPSPTVTTSVTPTTFQPNRTCTRAQVVTFLYRAIAE